MNPRAFVALACLACTPGCWLGSSLDFPTDAGSREAQPITFVQGTWHAFDNEAMKHTLGLSRPVRRGDLLVVAFGYPSSAQGATVSDVLGNTFNLSQAQGSTDPPDGTWFGIEYAEVETAGQDEISITLSGTTLMDLYLAEFSGAPRFAGARLATGASSKSGEISSGLLTMKGDAAAQALVVGFAVGDSIDPGGGFSTAALSPDGVLEYRIGPVRAPVAATATLMGGGRWGVAMSTFTP